MQMRIKWYPCYSFAAYRDLPISHAFAVEVSAMGWSPWINNYLSAISDVITWAACVRKTQKQVFIVNLKAGVIITH